MSLLNQWLDLMEGQTKATIDEFWKEYSETETKIYTYILSDHEKKLEGKFSDLVEKFDCNKIIFMGFLDGINSSLKKELDLKKVTEDSEISLDIDFEKLYFNMHKADADYLWSIPEWDKVLTLERREEIYKEYKRSKTVHVEKKPGRNDPCPCGSGLKYKKCCGKNA